MFIEKLNIEIFSDYQIKGKKPQTDKIGNLSFEAGMGIDIENLEKFIDATLALYPFDPARLSITFETQNN